MAQLTLESCFPQVTHRPKPTNRGRAINPVFSENWKVDNSPAELPRSVTACFSNEWKSVDRGGWLAGLELCCDTASSTRLCFCNLPNPHICNTTESPTWGAKITPETPLWPGQKPRYKRKHSRARPTQIQPKKTAVEIKPSAEALDNQWFLRQTLVQNSESPFTTSLKSYHVTSKSTSQCRFKRQRRDEICCSCFETENYLDPHIDYEWRLFEDSLAEWPCSSSLPSLVSDGADISKASTSPMSDVETPKGFGVEEDRMVTTHERDKRLWEEICDEYGFSDLA